MTSVLVPTFPIRTARLSLRPFRDEDIPAILAYRGSPEACRWVPFQPMDRAAVEAKLRGDFSRRALEHENQGLFLAIEVTANGAVAGEVMLRWASEVDRSGEVGWMLAPEFGGQGLASEAAHAMLHLGFDQLGLHRVVARVDGMNERSARLARRLGMRLEAEFLQSEWFKGRWSDNHIFALLEDEWQAPQCDGPGCLRPSRLRQVDPEDGER
jgi:RimJ/RimL family protein N-acetyltransferase